MHTVHMYFTSFQNVYMCTRLTGHSWWTMFRFFSPHQLIPLHLAAREGKEGTVQLLIEKGAEINTKDNDGVHEWVCITDCVLVLVISGYDVMIVYLILKVLWIRYLVRITGQSACKPGSKITHCTSNEYMYPYNVQHLVWLSVPPHCMKVYI